MSFLRKLFGLEDKTHVLLSEILSASSNREDMLGMKDVIIPTPDGIKVDAAKIVKYTDTDGYKKFAEEAWGQVINGLDKILDPKANKEIRDFYCGEVNATLNLLRLSYRAKEVIKHYDQQASATFRTAVRKE